MVEAVGYFKRLRDIVVKHKDDFAFCHVVFSPLGVFNWYVLASHVVNDVFDDSIGECAGNVKEKARDGEAFFLFFEYPVYC